MLIIVCWWFIMMGGLNQGWDFYGWGYFQAGYPQEVADTQRRRPVRFGVRVRQQ